MHYHFKRELLWIQFACFPDFLRSAKRAATYFRFQIITFSKFDEHTSPLFKITGILKFFDLVTLHISLFMFKFHKKLLPTVFDTYFRPISTIHNYRTRLSSKDAFSLPRVRTNFGIFNIRFSGVKFWNALETDIKLLSMSAFKARLKSSLISKY